jgi:hypothetical protein
VAICGGGTGLYSGTDRPIAKIWHNLAIWQSLPESGTGVQTPVPDFFENLKIWHKNKSGTGVPPIWQQSGNNLAKIWQQKK